MKTSESKTEVAPNRLAVYIDIETHRRLKSILATKGETLTGLLRVLIAEYLKSQD